MTKGSKEFYDIQQKFEKDVLTITYGHNIERDKNNIKGIFYCDGYINTLFQAYMLGYSYKRCLDL